MFVLLLYADYAERYDLAWKQFSLFDRSIHMKLVNKYKLPFGYVCFLVCKNTRFSSIVIITVNKIRLKTFRATPNVKMFGAVAH